MQTIGERLEEARKKKGVSIREAAEATKIRGDYLQKFESNQFDIGLTEIYTRGFLRTYASFLKIPADRVMSDYAALGRGDIRPRQPSREVYGRMDISVASSSEAADRAAPPAETPAAEPAAAARSQPRNPRGPGSSLPSGPDPAVVFKWVKIGGVVVGLLIVVLVIRALFSGGSRATPATPAAAPQPSVAQPPVAPQQPTATFTANGVMHLKVQRDNASGETLFDRGLNRGETISVPRTGVLFITCTSAENLDIDLGGRRLNMGTALHGASGYQVAQLPAP